ncbi:MAG TPA: hypothetical protein VN688_02880 [Gemmataceae bacterium]|nr:hypothetical protein [Gemmataceae bacterium]
MLADTIQAKFPKGIRVPDDLRKLCDFAEEQGNSVSGCFELGADTADSWFGNAEDASRFAVFGCGPDGSLIALWFYKEMDSAEAPVVNLGSEGDDNIVLAANIREFLKLLGIGYSEFGPNYVTCEPDEPDSAADLREWLAEEYGMESPETAEPILQEARRLHPDVDAWIEEWRQKRDESA